MGKKKSVIGLFLIGMVLVVVGCFLPLTSASNFGLNGKSAFDAITANGSGVLKVGSILALAGAVAGIVFSFVSVKGAPVKLISLIVSMVGGAYVIINYLNVGGIAKHAIKFANSIAGTKPSIGLFVIIAGWILGIVGLLKSK